MGKEWKGEGKGRMCGGVWEWGIGVGGGMERGVG